MPTSSFTAYKKLTVGQTKCSGRNNNGQITVRHRGGAHKRCLRLIDFYRNKHGVHGIVERIEYDPNRQAPIALVLYADGDRKYILAPKTLQPGVTIVSGMNASVAVGHALPVHLVPIGMHIHCIELVPGRGAQLAKTPGAYATVLAKQTTTTTLKLSSGLVVKVANNCISTVGEVGLQVHKRSPIGKAGRTRWLGIRPTVRGVAMNPVDHPHGGGEGKTAAKRPPVTPWGQLTKGFKTSKHKPKSIA